MNEFNEDTNDPLQWFEELLEAFDRDDFGLVRRMIVAAIKLETRERARKGER